jgi:tetrapyrrole methylase family protein / MazG family protein
MSPTHPGTGTATGTGLTTGSGGGGAGPRVVVVGLGPAGAELVNEATRSAIAAVPVRFLRTRRHPAASLLAGSASFDEVYESAATFADVYEAIADRLGDEAGRHGQVLYAVPGSPLVLERSVRLLLQRPGLTVDILPAMSFLDLAWARLGVDPVEAGVRLVDGHTFGVDAAGERGPLLVAHCHSRLVLSQIKLSVEDPDPVRAVVLQRLGCPDEAVFEVAWSELDRSFDPDHLTALWIPELAAPVAREVARFDELVHTLRQRCPWDREQTHRSLTPHLLEESYEVIDAIDGLGPHGQGDDLLAEELGDLLFQVVFHATLAGERGAFTLADVALGIHDKLVHRHPHVFGSTEATDAGTVLANWEQIKRAEKGRLSVMEGIPAALPALLRAEKVQRKAERSGLDAASFADREAFRDPSLDAARGADGLGAPPLDAALDGDGLGDLLFRVVGLARARDIDPEAALRGATRRFETRFRSLEVAAAAAGVDLHVADLEWLRRAWAGTADAPPPGLHE